MAAQKLEGHGQDAVPITRSHGTEDFIQPPERGQKKFDQRSQMLWSPPVDDGLLLTHKGVCREACGNAKVGRRWTRCGPS